jgi:hypothetical protein
MYTSVDNPLWSESFLSDFRGERNKVWRISSKLSSLNTEGPARFLCNGNGSPDEILSICLAQENQEMYLSLRGLSLKSWRLEILMHDVATLPPPTLYQCVARTQLYTTRPVASCFVECRSCIRELFKVVYVHPVTVKMERNIEQRYAIKFCVVKLNETTTETF